MATKTKNPEEQSAVAAMKEQRARDAVLAMREYEQDKLAVRARTERLRALRLARETEAAKAPPVPAVATRKKPAKKKA